MTRRLTRFISAAAPAVAVVTVVGTGVSQAEVSRVSPGPRILADAAPAQAPTGEATHPRAAASHRTKPVVRLTCHETDKPAAGPTPTAGTDSSQPTGPARPGSTVSASGTTESDTVVCHWSHIRRHLKVGSFELLRGTAGSTGSPPAVVQSVGAKTRSFTDTSVTDGTAYTYVLHVLAADGSQVGTSNTVKVKDHDDQARARGEAQGQSRTTNGKRANSPASAQADSQPPADGTATPDNGTVHTSSHRASGGAGPAIQHRGRHGQVFHSSLSRSHRDSTE